MNPTAATLRVDLDALAANFHTLAAQAAGAQVCPVVKADGYGLGAAQVSRRLYAEGARAFFVARLSEGDAHRPRGAVAVLRSGGQVVGVGARAIARQLAQDRRAPRLGVLQRLDHQDAGALAHDEPVSRRVERP